MILIGTIFLDTLKRIVRVPSAEFDLPPQPAVQDFLEILSTLQESDAHAKIGP
jgi:hypothetical protein